MSNYSSFERNIASFFRKFPRLKSSIKSLYQRINFLFNRNEYEIKTDYEIKSIEYEGLETFFGYYDKSPLNESQNKIIFQASQRSTKLLPNKNSPIHIILKNFVTNEVLFKDELVSYNWQQGCKLQWIDDEFFIYNSYSESKKQYISKKVSSLTYKMEVFSYPIYDTFKTFGLTLNYETLSKLRPDYGYRNGDNRFVKLDHDNDGIFSIDLNNNSVKKILSIKDVIALKETNSTSKTLHKFNHIMISPNGDKFMFLHRWFEKGVKHDRLIVCDVDGGNPKVIMGDEMVSHCFWKNNDDIITFANTKAGGDAYYQVSLFDQSILKLDFEGSKTNGDGHPNIYNGKWMLFDTYPNRSRIKHLFKINLETNQVVRIGDFFESFSFRGENRCDLHPRWSPKGDMIFIDSVHGNNKRKLYLIKNK